jgi:hypothetical protein
MNQAEQIIEEVIHLVKKHKKEIPQKGRGWPTSIRE